MRTAPRPLAVITALALVVGALAAMVGTASASDPRGAYRVADTPLPPAGPGDPVVALTFDDGPHPEFTPKVLEVLRRYNVKATFFMLGSQAEKYPDLVRQVQADGHAIANHTYSHPHLPRLDEAGFAAQVDRTQDVLQTVTGVRPTCVRPPYGDSDPATVARLQARGLTPVFWTADSSDFEKPGAAAITQGALAGLSNGSIVLMHDAGGDRSQTLAALPGVIEQIVARGFRFAPVCQPDVHLPKGSIDVIEPKKGRFRVGGWLADPDAAEPIEAEVVVDGTVAGKLRASGDRPDLAAYGLATRHGFDLELDAAPGPHQVCVRGLNVGPGSSNPSIGCVGVEVLDPVPFSILDEVNRILWVRAVEGLTRIDPSLRYRQAVAAYWTMLLTRP